MKAKKVEYTLRLVRFIKVFEHDRSSFDRRVFVDKYLYEYSDNDGGIYRKEFEVKSGKPNVPSCGTHTEINNAAKQW